VGELKTKTAERMGVEKRGVEKRDVLPRLPSY
jgi:hypothetical protein